MKLSRIHQNKKTNRNKIEAREFTDMIGRRRIQNRGIVVKVG